MLKRILKTAALAIAGMPCLLAAKALTAISMTFSEKIKSDEQLEKIINEESYRLGISANIKGKFHKNYAASTYALDEKPLYIFHVGGFGAKRSTVKHELYHFKNHTHGMDKDLDSFFIYAFKEELQATLYSLGINV